MTKKYALITGASSGFGVNFAHILAKEGKNLIITARRIQNLENLKRKIEEKYNVKVEVVPADLSNLTGVKSLIDKTENFKVDILINNAGFGVYGHYLNSSWDDLNKMIQVDITALAYLSHTFGNKMKKAGRGSILLVGSVAAFQATPTYAAYAASKAFVLHLGEALNYELKGSGVNVTVLNPGITATEFLKVSGQKTTLFQKIFMMQSYPVALTGIKAMFAKRSSVIAGIGNKTLMFLSKFAPRKVQMISAYYTMKN